MKKSILASICAVLFLTNLTFANRNIVIVFDDSGSMSGRKIVDAKKSLVNIVETLDDETRVGVLLLNGGWIFSDDSKLMKVNKEEIKKVVAPVAATGGTPLGNAIRQGAEVLRKLRKQYRQGNYQLLVITDGEATDQNLVSAVVPDVMARQIRIDVIGVDMSSRHSLAKSVTTYREAKDATTLTNAIKEVLAESSATASDDNRSDSDFELISAIPDQSAPDLIKALANLWDDVPVGEKRKESLIVDDNGNVAVDGNGQVMTEAVEESFGIGFWVFVVVLVVFAIGVIVLAIIVHNSRGY